MARKPHTNEQPHSLTDPARRAILATLEDVDQPLHVEDLAERLVHREIAVVDTATYEAKLEQTLIHLHHNHLPRLAQAGLIEYDRETNIVSADARDRIDTARFETAELDELIASVAAGDGDDEGTIQVLKGRESVIEFGRQLADDAEDELFCLFVSTDLLEDDCVRRARNAIDRDVTMSMGSQNPAVRELTRNQLPQATIWEPQLDWLNTPSYPRLGRLVLVDRRKVMLSVLQEPAPDGSAPDEVAIVGEGEDNPLVVLVRDLLGSRLDHLDYQSETFRSEYVA